MKMCWGPIQKVIKPTYDILLRVLTIYTCCVCVYAVVLRPNTEVLPTDLWYTLRCMNLPKYLLSVDEVLL